MMKMNEILEQCKIPYMALHIYCSEKKIKGKNIIENGKSVLCFSDEDSKDIIDYFEEKARQKANEAYLKSLPKEERIKELRKQHPLVVDDRCFDNNWWPDPIPDCFKEVV